MLSACKAVAASLSPWCVVLMQGSSASLGKSGSTSKGGKGPGSKAKDPIQERKEAQLADEAQVLTLCLPSIQCAPT